MNEYSYQERYMGTDVSLSFVCKKQAYANTIAAKTFDIIHAYELRLSRFLPDSELSKLNRLGHGVVSDEFYTVLQRSLKLVELTKGAFNPLVQVAILGYQNTYEKLAEKLIDTTPSQYDTDPSKIVTGKSRQNITLGQNQQLDFGGILKGYLANLLADKITQEYPECTGCIINIGGDIATRGTDNFHEPFIFMLYNPVTGIDIPVVIQDNSLATSGTYARRWQTNLGIQHHIVDTVTQNNPDNNIITVSIIHHDGALTEALTKLFLTRGIEEATRTIPPEQYSYQYFVVFNTGDIESNITSI